MPYEYYLVFLLYRNERELGESMHARGDGTNRKEYEGNISVMLLRGLRKPTETTKETSVHLERTNPTPPNGCTQPRPTQITARQTLYHTCPANSPTPKRGVIAHAEHLQFRREGPGPRERRLDVGGVEVEFGE